MIKAIVNLFRKPAAKAGGRKELEMPEASTQPDNVTPPAASGGITQEQLQAAVAAAIAAEVAPLQATIADLQAKVSQAPAALTAEQIKELIAADNAQARAAGEAAAKKASARQAVIAGKLAGVPEEFLAKLPDTDDAAALDQAADAIVARWNEVGAVKPADLGGAAADGGAIPGQGVPAATNSPLPAGLAKYAAGLKLPDSGAAQPAAAK